MNAFMAIYILVGVAIFCLVAKRIFDEFSLADVLFLLLVCSFFWPAMLGGAIWQIVQDKKK